MKDHIIICFHLCEISRIGKSSETESRLVVLELGEMGMEVGREAEGVWGFF